jgi:hypothetical protein
MFVGIVGDESGRPTARRLLHRHTPQCRELCSRLELSRLCRGVECSFKRGLVSHVEEREMDARNKLIARVEKGSSDGEGLSCRSSLMLPWN